ncbi:uncharacterized protein LOC129766505 [Toxorhynchites rutilus septentrionalis]|uniref:uncharacterized protein LOC129766505 n=1 Tax=Toxorhynchites rutilus septentrionalis TaxID=329112 RepID=UPI00247B2C30|nr:uncharacterized protein LOC129766505 [Toxorhynchites rutilus septentrionalis]
MEICNSCASNMTSAEVVCGGFCKATFHFKCARITEALYNEIIGNPAVFWMCKGCCDIMGNACFRNTITSMNSVTAELNNMHKKVVEELKTEIKDSLIAELRLEIQGGFNKLSPAVLSPLPHRFQFDNRSSPKRARDDDPERLERPTKIFRGTGLMANGATIATAVRTESRFWMYLSKISPEVSEADIQNLAKECLQTDDVVAKSLIPRGRPLNTLTFVLFKVDINQSLKTKAMDPSTWPQGIEFREFEDNGSTSRHFWKPAPIADPGASTSTNNPIQLT